MCLPLIGAGVLWDCAQFCLGRQPQEKSSRLSSVAPILIFFKYGRLHFLLSVSIIIFINDTSWEPIMCQTSCHWLSLHHLWPSYQLWKLNSNYSPAQEGNFPPLSLSCGRWSPLTHPSSDCWGHSAFTMHSGPCWGSYFDPEWEIPDHKGYGVLFRQLAWAQMPHGAGLLCCLPGGSSSKLPALTHIVPFSICAFG